MAASENFSRTAESLDLTQPAVSQQMRALQAHFGLGLEDVAGRRTRLTDAGRFLAARAGELLGNVAALERDMREFADAAAGELRIGASATAGTYLLPALLARFRVRHPAIATHVEIGNTATVAASLREGRAGVGLVEGPLEDDAFVIRPFRSDELVLIVPAAHPLAARRVPVAFAELAATPLVSREPGSGTREQAERAFAEAGVAPDIILSLPSGEAIVRAVEAGIGAAFVSRVVAGDALAAGRIAAVATRGLPLTRTFRIVHVRDRTQSPAARAFAALLLETDDGD